MFFYLPNGMLTTCSTATTDFFCDQPHSFPISIDPALLLSTNERYRDGSAYGSALQVANLFYPSNPMRHRDHPEDVNALSSNTVELNTMVIRTLAEALALVAQQAVSIDLLPPTPPEQTDADMTHINESYLTSDCKETQEKEQTQGPHYRTASSDQEWHLAEEINYTKEGSCGEENNGTVDDDFSSVEATVDTDDEYVPDDSLPDDSDDDDSVSASSSYSIGIKRRLRQQSPGRRGSKASGFSEYIKTPSPAVKQTATSYDPATTQYLKSIFFTEYSRRPKLTKAQRQEIQKHTKLSSRKITYWFSNHKRRFQGALKVFKSLVDDTTNNVKTYEEFLQWRRDRNLPLEITQEEIRKLDV
ncbi:uncharacterized protein BYT42DRAFT_570223 [Radiomyces spectabilis]|uniref:uncharacterized protein n=1 Tax=Radiomyces spectabilis TaxID=64574 RepID=UPI0022209B5F|nr:uncharacterized protein BYT42DRAFT_570223 [Radiomyces spectabilis]KAI8377401.1 hypothetical protein BYT42DRAFT_570223 [Radiomyces spectabilis]